MKVASFTSTSPSGRSLGSIGSQYSSCIAIDDHAFDTTGGASIGPSPITTVLSVLPPRIMPPYKPRYMTLRPSSAAARGEHLRRELHTLAADTGDQQLSFHVTSLR